MIDANAPASTALAAVVLAAGGSSRLGRPKQLVTIDGGTLLARVVDVALEAGCTPVVVVVGRDAGACVTAIGDRAVLWAQNDAWAAGLGTSIRTGVCTLLDATATERAVLLLCDQPGIDAATVRRLDAAQRQSGRPVAVAAYADTIGPPVLVTGDWLRRLRDWPDDRGAKELWASRPADVMAVDCPEAAADVDTPADYERLLREKSGSR